MREESQHSLTLGDFNCLIGKKSVEKKCKTSRRSINNHRNLNKTPKSLPSPEIEFTEYTFSKTG